MSGYASIAKAAKDYGFTTRELEIMVEENRLPCLRWGRYVRLERQFFNERAPDPIPTEEELTASELAVWLDVDKGVAYTLLAQMKARPSRRAHLGRHPLAASRAAVQRWIIDHTEEVGDRYPVLEASNAS